MAKIKIPIQLGDPAYFKDKSWTLSFNFNTKSWVSFHSYLPNFYIAENNFFYSGLNNCCGDFDFIASEIPSLIDCTIYGYCVAEGYELDCLIEGGCCCLPTTTTTSTTIISTTTTTTLSTACDLEGTIEEVCYVSTTTTTTECIRPNDLNTYSLITGFISEGIPFDSTVDKYVACDTMHWLEDNPSVTRTNIYAETTDIYIGAHLFLYNGTNDCECVPDGWYFTDESMFYGYVFHVEDCIITEVYTCEVTTTTTSTTVEPTTTTTTTTAYDCNLEGDVTEVCPTTSTTSTTVPPTTTTTTTCEPVEFEVIDIEWGTTTTTTTTVCPIDAYLVDVVCEDVTTTTTTTVAPTTTTTTTVPPTTTTTTTYEPISTTTTTTTVLESCVEYGYLYNWYAATDVREISSSDDWVVPVNTDWESLISYLGGNDIAGGKLKETGTTHWNSPNTGATNEAGFYGVGNGRRYSDGVFMDFKYKTHSMSSNIYTPTDRYYGFALGYDNDNANATTMQPKGVGTSIRLLKTSTALSHGETGTYIGNDGKIYPTICIGTQEWVASNLAETLYRNGDPIPTVEDATTWAGLTTGAKCAYDNDYTNVGCDETAPTTTTTTTIDPSITTTTTTTTTTEEVTTTTTTTLATPTLLVSSHANGQTCMEYDCCNPDNFPHTRRIFTPINTVLNIYFGVGTFTYSDLEYIEVTSIESDVNHHLEYNYTTVLANDKIYNNGLSSFEYGHLNHIITNYTGNTSDLFDVTFKAKFYGYNLSDEFLMRLYLNFSICPTTTTTTIEPTTTTTTTYEPISTTTTTTTIEQYMSANIEFNLLIDAELNKPPVEQACFMDDLVFETTLDFTPASIHYGGAESMGSNIVEDNNYIYLGLCDSYINDYVQHIIFRYEKSTGIINSVRLQFNTYSDYHKVPTLYISSTGALLYCSEFLPTGGHNAELKILRWADTSDLNSYTSTDIGNISTERLAYPYIFEINGEIIIEARRYATRPPYRVYYKSSNDGVSFGSMTEYINYGTNNYWIYSGQVGNQTKGDDIILSVTPAYYPVSSQIYKYVAFLRTDFSGNFYDLAGNNLGSSLNRTTLESIKSWGVTADDSQFYFTRTFKIFGDYIYIVGFVGTRVSTINISNMQIIRVHKTTGVVEEGTPFSTPFPSTVIQMTTLFNLCGKIGIKSSVGGVINYYWIHDDLSGIELFYTELETDYHKDFLVDLHSELTADYNTTTKKLRVFRMGDPDTATLYVAPTTTTTTTVAPTTTTITTTVAPVELLAGLISVWEFDETSGTTVIDSHGSNDGTSYNATLNQSGTTNITPSYYFNGTNAYALVPATDFYFNPLIESYSVNIWVKSTDPTPVDGTTTVRLFINWSGAGGAAYPFVFYVRPPSDNQDVWIQVYNGSIMTKLVLSGSSGLWDGNWHMLTMVVDHVFGYVHGYKDGNSTTFDSQPITFTSYTPDTSYANMNIAKIPTINANYYSGYIDQIGIWNKALTTDEITELYNSGDGLAYTNW